MTVMYSGLHLGYNRMTLVLLMWKWKTFHWSINGCPEDIQEQNSWFTVENKINACHGERKSRRERDPPTFLCLNLFSLCLTSPRSLFDDLALHVGHVPPLIRTVCVYVCESNPLREACQMCSCPLEQRSRWWDQSTRNWTNKEASQGWT